MDALMADARPALLLARKAEVLKLMRGHQFGHQFERNSTQLGATAGAWLRLGQDQHEAEARSHNPEVAGSNPAPATHRRPAQAGFRLSGSKCSAQLGSTGR